MVIANCARTQNEWIRIFWGENSLNSGYLEVFYQRMVMKNKILFMESGSSHLHKKYQKVDNNIDIRTKYRTWHSVQML